MRFNEKFSLKLSLSFNSFLQNYMFDLIIGVYYLKYSFFVKRIFLTLYIIIRFYSINSLHWKKTPYETRFKTFFIEIYSRYRRLTQL
jgi:hypothetical protein